MTVAILVVEDNPGDAGLLEEAFVERGSSAKLAFTGNGFEALFALLHDDSSSIPHPDLIVLDLKMPGMDGLTFLRELRSKPTLRDIAVAILTGSDEPDDIRASSSLGAKGYFNKPMSVDGWETLSKRLEALASKPGEDWNH